MRKLASLVTIDKVEPIPETDRLSVATMVGKGWKVVVGRDEFKPGTSAVYFEIDSYLPDEERYAFLRERCLRKFCSKSGAVLKQGLRIKTIKLRGVISQGLLMPVSKDVFPELFGDDPIRWETGADLSELLHVEHFDDIKAALAPQMGTQTISGDALGPFPSCIPKTDEERIQNLVDYFTTMRDRRFEVSVKEDGSSVTMAYAPSFDPENPFMVCSRNLRLKPQKANGEAPLPWLMAAKYDMEKKLREYHDYISHMEYAFQGELTGPGIQSNRDLSTEHTWHVFRVFNITTQEMLLPQEARDLCRRLNIPYVPLVAETMPVFQKFPSVDDLLKFAEGKTAKGNEREGLVFKSVDRPYVSFKAVSNRYLLKLEK